MKRSGHADLPLHHGRVPEWLASRMAKLGRAVTEAMILEYGSQEVVRRLSDPMWFQALGCVMGMDWHSSGITTSVLGALKRAINPVSKDLGLYICGGRGRHSRKTPEELLTVADQTGMDGNQLVQCSKLSAKIDNTAIQDGFQLYLHSFILSENGDWSVIQQGMNDVTGYARRYHWHSAQIRSFIEEPHTAICGENQGPILNLTDRAADPTRKGVVSIAEERPERMIAEIRKIKLPRHHDVRSGDVDIKRLGSVLALAQEVEELNFESLLLLKGLGPRTLQSLALVSEVIYGTPSRFKDPARFSFAHGGKDGHPFPVPLKVYDETITVLKQAVDKAKIGFSDKQKAIRALHDSAKKVEKQFIPNQNLDQLIEEERKNSHRYGGMTVAGKVQPDFKNGLPQIPSKAKKRKGGNQLDLFN